VAIVSDAATLDNFTSIITVAAIGTGEIVI
jgi:hypothetical protein